VDVAIDARDKRIADLEATVERLIAEVQSLRSELAKAHARIAELEEQLGQTSRNSSKPPSSDPPTVTRPPKPPSGRSRGAQTGHKGHKRALFPEDKVANVVDRRPSRCERCQRRLTGDDPAPRRHQVAELPPIEPVVSEYRLHSLQCTCGHVTKGTLPKGTPTGAFGPTVVATITMLLGVYGLSRRDVVELMGDVFHLPISVGAVVGCQRLGAEALGPAYQQIEREIPKAPVRYMDETGWKMGELYACLWVVVTPTVTLFRVHAERSRAAAMQILGKVQGLLCSDRYSVYDVWPTHLHQFCWAHLARLFVKFSERRDPEVAAMGRDLITEKEQMFAWWHRVRDGTLSRRTFQEYMRPLKVRVADLLKKGLASSCDKTRRTCTRLLENTHALWAFVHKPDLEPTNNIGERALRRAVIQRKTSFGSQSDHGCRFFERVLSVHATLRQRGRNVHDFVVESCRARTAGLKPPSVLARA